ncbi:MAG: hypothetical protein ACOCWO_05740 [Candidatus Muiribacteriaceae bacterium]
MILIHYFIFLILFLGILVIFYPYSVYVHAEGVKRFLIHIDLCFVDIFYIVRGRRKKIRISILGMYTMSGRRRKRKGYTPDLERLFFIAGFLCRHLKKILSFISIRMMGLDILLGISEYYLLSQIHTSCILLNNILPGSMYVNLLPEYEKEVFRFAGRARAVFHLNRLIWFFIVLLFHPATYLAVWEYYRYNKKQKSI